MSWWTNIIQGEASETQTATSVVPSPDSFSSVVLTEITAALITVSTALSKSRENLIVAYENLSVLKKYYYEQGGSIPSDVQRHNVELHDLMVKYEQDVSFWNPYFKKFGVFTPSTIQMGNPVAIVGAVLGVVFLLVSYLGIREWRIVQVAEINEASNTLAAATEAKKADLPVSFIQSVVDKAGDNQGWLLPLLAGGGAFAIAMFLKKN